MRYEVYGGDVDGKKGERTKEGSDEMGVNALIWLIGSEKNNKRYFRKLSDFS
jgi:hypothetical protein